MTYFLQVCWVLGSLLGSLWGSLTLFKRRMRIQARALFSAEKTQSQRVSPQCTRVCFWLERSVCTFDICDWKKCSALCHTRVKYLWNALQLSQSQVKQVKQGSEFHRCDFLCVCVCVQTQWCLQGWTWAVWATLWKRRRRKPGFLPD